MIYLTTCLGGAWFLEQPRGSSFEYYPAFRKMMMDLRTVANGTAATCRISIAFSKKSSYCTLSHTFVGYRPQAPRNKHAEVFRVSWWMAHYGGPSPKRHVGFGNSREIQSLDRGRLRRAAHKTRVRTTNRRHNSSGKECWTGNQELRASE